MKKVYIFPILSVQFSFFKEISSILAIIWQESSYIIISIEY